MAPCQISSKEVSEIVETFLLILHEARKLKREIQNIVREGEIGIISQADLSDKLLAVTKTTKEDKTEVAVARLMKILPFEVLEIMAASYAKKA